MFLHMSVILSTGGVPAPEGRSAPTGGVPAPGGGLVPGGACCRGVCSWGVPAAGGSAPGVVETSPVTATAADGTHPTGMHSCLFIFRATQELKVMKANEAYFIDVISRVLFPLLFAIFNVIYWSYYLTRY